jgi:hypothetical protein
MSRYSSGGAILVVGDTELGSSPDQGCEHALEKTEATVRDAEYQLSGLGCTSAEDRVVDVTRPNPTKPSIAKWKHHWN